MIRTVKLSHHYGVRPILRNVSFELPAGRTLAIVGPNGIGKSTLLKVLGGVMSPTEGVVEINGLIRRSSVDEELAIRQQAVYLPDECWLPQGMSGRQWLLSVGGVYGIPTARLFDHIERLLKVFHLSEIADADMNGYSAGQKKKIALCSALLTDAAFLLLDEPYSGGLDPAGIAALTQILKRLAEREDRTIVLTAPVPELCEEIASHVLIMHEGEVQFFGTMDEVKREADDAPTLAEALQRLTFPETQAEIETYFAGEDEARLTD